MTKKMLQKTSVNKLYEDIRSILEKAKSYAYKAVNFAMVTAYWQIGKVIVEEEQKGKERAEYGSFLIQELSQRLTKEYGKGFTKSNLFYMKQFYLAFPKVHALRGESQKVNALRSELSWTHYRLLLKVDEEAARNFYMLECVENNWSTRELERQINSLLYERLVLSKGDKKVKELAKKGHIVRKPEDIIKDPYVLEFLGLEKNEPYLEKHLEDLLVEKLKDFLLERGRGFSFVERQKRISLDGDHFYIDLVFYNYVLKCFVLIDLKIGKLTHQDIGQMDFYVRYFEKEVRQKGDNPTIGLILCSDKNEAMVRYTLLKDSKHVFASKYKLYLPSEKELKLELVKERERIETERKLAKK
ncbi:MAG: PDDEXK nuclease domain-containing protein [Nanoarchaeota archaeon]|nr:PDDEXK nuclease domain-containing protein [Nanoarchaeota archaeon]